MERTVAQKALAAYGSFADSVGARWAACRAYGSSLWQDYRPETLLGWTTFFGISLLALSAIGTAVNILAGLLLSLAWLGVAVYTVLVTMSTAGAVVMGTATFFVSGTCAVLGTCILSGACSAYVSLVLFNRLKSAAQSFLTPVQQKLVQAGPSVPLLATLQPVTELKATAVTAAPGDPITSPVELPPSPLRILEHAPKALKVTADLPDAAATAAYTNSVEKAAAPAAAGSSALGVTSRGSVIASSACSVDSSDVVASDAISLKHVQPVVAA